MYKNKEELLEIVKSNGWEIGNACYELRHDKEIAIEAVKQNGYSLSRIGSNLRDDIDVVLEALKENGYALKDVSDRLKADKQVVLQAVKQKKDSWEYASEEIYKLCEGEDKDPIKTLESAILAEKLQTALSHKQEQNLTKKFKI